MKKILWLSLLISSSLFAQTEFKPKLEAFIDTYYAYDFNNPKPNERQYTTQPARHNEANINLAYISGELNREKTRGKLTIQFGNSVTKNYSTEPSLGSTSGPVNCQMLQEAFAGYKLRPNLWIDAGIYLGHIGMESWISKYNYTYSRSLMLDYVPYYQTGARLTHAIDENNEVQYHLMNGWQNISENNQDKAFGLQYRHRFQNDLIFTYNNFLGNDKGVTGKITPQSKSTLRTYHNFIADKKLSDRFTLKAAFDIGTQEREDKNNNENIWTVWALVTRYQLKENHYLALRLEQYHDKNQANAVTNTPNGFIVDGASINFDKHLDENALWRIEYRHFHSKDAIYPKSNGLRKDDDYIVTSLAFTI